MGTRRWRKGRARADGLDLSTAVGPLELPNPVMTAAGTAGHGAELARYFDLSLIGAVVVKSLSVKPWAGNPSPRVCPVPGGMLNSVGLQGPGVASWARDELPRLEVTGARVVASLWGQRLEDFEQAARALAEVVSKTSAVVAVELNVSCPNLEDRSRMFAHSPEATAAVVGAARGQLAVPLFAKLSPNTPDLLEVAGAALSAGADGLTLVNTLLGLAIDIEHRRPALGAGGGGLSGPALHSVALRAVYECRGAFPAAGIIGVGGISDGRGALAMLMAGADAIEVGTATLADPTAPLKVLEDLSGHLARLGATTVRQVVGAAQGTSSQQAQ
jgi:dihydroorotate dehydrogenase (NAD+) catalytic subunit